MALEWALLGLWSSWQCWVCGPLGGMGRFELWDQRMGLDFLHVETCIYFHNNSVSPESGSGTVVVSGGLTVGPTVGQVLPPHQPWQFKAETNSSFSGTI